ncbi:siderophore-interacting protein [Streptomyces abyssalis]|uniref:Siderophore-interacting protein n=1 Tax=Streptomyces abyssalis TaxID=933944 RepID=A0A1E7JRA7_9ACTN|nr:siderophore-interacting protein [Streptomyces abyssalis]OEU95428.1 siderophore-interacting protein [Streptomyces abyssalis]
MEHFFAKQRLSGVVTETGSVTPTMKRVKIACDALAGVPVLPGRHVRIEINDPLSLYGILRPGETLRTYSVWDHSEAGGEFEIRAHLYDGDGIGLRWARDVQEGEHLAFWGPLGDFELQQDASYHLFVGEETAAAAFGSMIRALKPDAPVYGLLESETADDEVPLPGNHPMTRVHRRGASAVSSSTLLKALSELDLPGEPGAAYVAGEARTGQAVRNHLVNERSWPRAQVKVKPFWTPGKRGLHH